MMKARRERYEINTRTRKSKAAHPAVTHPDDARDAR